MRITSTYLTLGLRRNPVGVQLLSPSLHKQLFPGQPLSKPPPQLLDISKRHLQANNLDIEGAAVLPEISFDMPPLHGANIREHFQAVGAHVAEPYLSMAREFAKASLPEQPAQWEVGRAGWTKYNADGSTEAVKDLGDETLVSFDVETLYKVSPYPVMATAATPNAWYSWLSPVVFDEPSNPIPVTLIPLFPGKSTRSALVIGHNVGYDRARVFEEYHIDRTPTRWLDTLSLHVATRGITSVQRPAWMKHRKNKLEKTEMEESLVKVIMDAAEEEGDEELFHSAVDLGDSAGGSEPSNTWEDMTSTNSLAEVSRLHCGTEVDKSVRSRFSDDSFTHPSQLVPELPTLLQYCADDVQITHNVYAKVLPLFLLSCQHPASFAGALTMGNPFLPVDEHWQQYLHQAESKYKELHDGVHEALITLAEALRARGEDSNDPWSSQLDWTPKAARWEDETSRKAAGVEAQAPGKVQETMDEVKAASESESMLEPMSLDDPCWLDSILKRPQSLMDKSISHSGMIGALLGLTFKSFPLLHSTEHLWIFAVPKDEASKYEHEHGSPVQFSKPADGDLAALSKHYAFFKIDPSGPKFSSPFSNRAKRLWSTGTLQVKNKAAKDKFAVKSRLEREDMDMVVGLAKALAEEGPNGLFGPFLDWSSSASSKRSSISRRSSRSKSSKAKVGVWPTWYWELSYPPSKAEKLGISPTSLDITPRKSVTPLLLRMQWLGYPLYKLKNSGWTFRVPKGETEATDFSIKQKPVAFADLEEHVQKDVDGVYFPLPHPDGEGSNVGNPLAKHFTKHAETGKLSTATPIGADRGTAEATQRAMSMNSLCSYWMSARERIMSQLVVYQDTQRDMGIPPSPSGINGVILPQVITMGTVTRRAVEPTWLTASNAKKNRVGSELKAMVRAPKGYAIVGADVDSEELWIASVMGDSQFGTHGATAIGWMTLEGTKSAGSDLHSKTASILKTSRDSAKVFNYSRIYGAGTKHAVQLLLQNDATMSEEQAMELAKNLYKATKGAKARKSVANTMWHGGSESYLFNTLESIAQSSTPMTPALGCGVTHALKKSFLPNGTFGSDYLPSRINWVVQSSGVDYLHLLIVSMEYLIKRYSINARYLISVHDEVRYLATEEDRLRTALALQIANAWTRALFCYNLGMDDLPQGVAFFSAVDVDHVLRKEVDMPCVTPSQPIPIPPGESLDIKSLLELTENGRALYRNARDTPVVPAPQTPIAEKPDILSSDHQQFLEAQASASPALAKIHLNKRRSPASPASSRARGGKEFSLIDHRRSAASLNEIVESELPF